MGSFYWLCEKNEKNIQGTHYMSTLLWYSQEKSSKPFKIKQREIP